VGSARAENTRESGSAATVILHVINHSVKHNLKPTRSVVNQLVANALRADQ
jgi:hypothetical protein